MVASFGKDGLPLWMEHKTGDLAVKTKASVTEGDLVRLKELLESAEKYLLMLDTSTHAFIGVQVSAKAFPDHIRKEVEAAGISLPAKVNIVVSKKSEAAFIAKTSDVLRLPKPTK